ncbi:MAG: transcriptional repressor [Verrucomicrobia bacterium]|nr:transcriptional repressor [Verrucomicrobiota bacterium]
MSTNTQDWLSHCTQEMRIQGMRITRPLRSVLEVFSSSSRPLKAEEVRQLGGFQANELVTVYRNLERLQQAGFLQRLLLEDGVQVFERSQPGEHQHHIICRTCCRAVPLDAHVACQLEAQARKLGFQQLSHVVNFGICGECQDPQNSD